jgi:tRNA(fMet)-specific endonuclease VapC
MNYLLDTDICIYIINQKPPVVLKRVQSKRPGQIAISTITIAELEYGVARSRYPDRNRIALLEFLFPFTILEFDQKAPIEYGQIRALLETKGRPVGPMDLLLAAQAKSHNLILVTNNEKEFQRIDGLRLENWAHS